MNGSASRARPAAQRRSGLPRPGGRMLAALLWCYASIGPQALAADSQTAEAAAPVPSATDALAAYDRFRAAPEQSLAEATTFLRYMQGGAVHTVLDDRLMFFMYRDLPPDVRAVLYAAYMGGNLESQLRTRKAGDDPVAGMHGVLAAYAALRESRADLAIAELDTLATAAAAQRLPAAVEALRNGTP